MRIFHARIRCLCILFCFLHLLEWLHKSSSILKLIVIFLALIIHHCTLHYRFLLLTLLCHKIHLHLFFWSSFLFSEHISPLSTLFLLWFLSLLSKFSSDDSIKLFFELLKCNSFRFVNALHGVYYSLSLLFFSIFH